MACVQTDGDGRVGMQALHQLGDLLQLAAERELCAGGVFDQDAEVGAREVDSGNRALDGLSRQTQALLTGQPLPASGMENEELRMKGQRALHLAAKGRD